MRAPEREDAAAEAVARLQRRAGEASDRAALEPVEGDPVLHHGAGERERDGGAAAYPPQRLVERTTAHRTSSGPLLGGWWDGTSARTM
ncbi:hypothetical protein [Nocardioides zeae]|uniref:Uncharacterized protein n=1 Tax=Nocardioides zeae TaxID=1457234 RepID=A0AAJ1X449_9ACTN|nr:hypothetical protein [Nocardioides zeae]MDQ1106434.1 hypothetical protein [Nocardioides zeae]